ncbi:MAG: DUF2007 domain-containing protein [Rhizobiales bacterium]|nr:DUF2007 domain-containing protein [Hyphomicrobiales bacterium]
MIELIRTNDPVLLSFLEHLLGEAGIGFVVLDLYTSSVEGSLGMLPRRMMVAEDGFDAARLILDDLQQDETS